MPSFVADHKLPYGTYVLREELSELFPNTEVKDTAQGTSSNSAALLIKELMVSSNLALIRVPFEKT